MKKPVFGKCPACGEKLTVTRLSCDKCNIDITGEFEMNKFTYLDKEDLDFVETFLRCQGSLKEVQSELGVSYPTAKKALDSVLEKLGYTVKNDYDTTDLLDRIDRGEITASQAAEIIKKSRKNNNQN